MLKGILGLANSRKGTLAVGVIAVSAVGMFCHVLTGLEFAGIVSTITAFYNYHQVKEDIALKGGTNV